MWGAAIMAAGGIGQTIMGIGQTQKAKSALDNYRRREFTNVAEGLGVSTRAKEYAQEQLSTTGASAIDAFKGMGARGVMGGTNKLVEKSLESAQSYGADLDQQQKDIDKMWADDQVRIRTLQEEREKADLAGLGQQLMTGQQNTFSGIGAVGQAAGSTQRMGADNQESGKGFFGGQTSAERLERRHDRKSPQY